MVVVERNVLTHNAGKTSWIGRLLNGFSQPSASSAYHDTFELIRADNKEKQGWATRLRYKVFCEENGFEEECSTGNYTLEDQYDDRAIHYILKHKISGEIVGTLRLVLPYDECPDESFPAQQYCKHPLLKQDTKVMSLCEISGFCTAPRFRKRDGDGRLLSTFSSPDEEDIQAATERKKANIRRVIPYAPAALLQGAFEAALEAGITDCVWMVEKCHLDSLKKVGISFRTLGPRVSYCEDMVPIIFNIKHALDNARRVNPHCWEILTDFGRLHDLADRVVQNHWHDSLIDEKCLGEICDTLM